MLGGPAVSGAFPLDAHPDPQGLAGALQEKAASEPLPSQLPLPLL